MSKLTLNSLLISTVCMAALISNSALAGDYYDRDVYISSDTLTAYGTLSAARWRPSNQSIGCSIETYYVSPSILCEAKNPAGVRMRCSLYPRDTGFDSAMQLISSISDSSYVYFKKRSSSDRCIALQVANNSKHIR